MGKGSRMGRVAVYGVAGLATAALGATTANAFAGDETPAPAPAPAPAAAPVAPPAVKTTPAPAVKPSTGTAPKAQAPAAPVKVATPVKKAAPAKKVRATPAAVHRSSATPHRVAEPAVTRSAPERKRFVVQAAAKPVVKLAALPTSVDKVLTHAEQRVTAAEQELTKIKKDLAQLRENLRTPQPGAHRKHDAKPSRDKSAEQAGRKKAAPARTVRKPVTPVRDIGPCKVVKVAKQGAGASSASAAMVCGSGSVQVG